MDPHPLIIIWTAGSALIVWAGAMNSFCPENPREWRWFLLLLVAWPALVAFIPCYAVWYVFFSDWVRRKKGR